MAKQVSNPARALAAAILTQAARDAVHGDDSAALFLYNPANAIWGTIAGIQWEYVRRWVLSGKRRMPRTPRAEEPQENYIPQATLHRRERCERHMERTR